VEKTPIYIFSTFGSKMNEFEQKKLEKIGKIPFKLVDIKISFEHVDSWAKSLLFRTHHL
jgi:hypothetical protein